MSDTTPKPPCGVCKGAYKEHFDDAGKPITQHAYTPNSGDLVTHQEMAKRHQPQQRVPFNPQMLTQASGPQLGRLVELLIERNLLGVEDGLYIAMMGPKPAAPSGFRDPVVKGTN